MHDVLSDSLICLVKSGLCLVKTCRETYSAPSRNPARDAGFRTAGNSNIYAVQLRIGERGKKTNHSQQKQIIKQTPITLVRNGTYSLGSIFFFFLYGGKKKKILAMRFHGYLTCCIITSLSGLTSFNWAAELPKWGSFS